MRKSPVAQLILLGSAHGLSDALAGFIIYSTPSKPLIKFSVIIIYTLIAFGLQPLSGYITDKLLGYRKSTFIGITLVLIGAAISLWMPVAGVIVLALGSSFFHVGAGAWAIRLTPNKAYGPGIYAAPGVLGLAIGIYSAIKGINLVVILLISLIVVGLLIYIFRNNPKVVNKLKITKDNNLAFFILAILTVGVCLRSSVWTQYQGDTYGVSLIIQAGIAAFLGKIIGGFVADRTSWRNFVLISLLGAFLGIANGSFVPALLIGLAFLQATTPFILMLIGRVIKKNLAFAVGCIVGLAILMGGILATRGYASGYFIQLLMVTAAFMLFLLAALIIGKYIKSPA